MFITRNLIIPVLTFCLLITFAAFVKYFWNSFRTDIESWGKRHLPLGVSPHSFHLTRFSSEDHNGWDFRLITFYADNIDNMWDPWNGCILHHILNSAVKYKRQGQSIKLVTVVPWASKTVRSWRDRRHNSMLVNPYASWWLKKNILITPKAVHQNLVKTDQCVVGEFARVTW